MKANFKFLFSLFLIFFLVGIVIAPVYAVTPRQSKLLSQNASTSPSDNSNFCNKLDDLSSRIDQNLDQKEKWLEEKRTDRSVNLTKRRANRDEKLKQFRDNWVENQDKLYKRLEEKAITTEQKEAVAAFKVKIETAVQVRQAAIDSAITTYRDSLDTLFVERKNAVDKAKADHRAAISEIFQKAETDCASGLSPVTIKAEVKENLSKAQNSYRADVVSIEKSADKVKDLADARKEAVNKAVEDFKATLNAAKIELKAAFGNE